MQIGLGLSLTARNRGLSAGAAVSAGHRYWRLWITEAYNTYASIGEIEFYDSGFTPLINGDTSGTFGTAPIEGTVAYAFDGIIGPGNYWAPPAALPVFIGKDFGVGKKVRPSRISIKARNTSFFNQGPKTLKVQWSDNGVDYTDEWVATLEANTVSDQVQNLDNPLYALDYTQYRFWRVTAPTTAFSTNWYQFGTELEFLNSSNVDISDTRTNLLGSPDESSFSKALLFNDNLGDFQQFLNHPSPAIVELWFPSTPDIQAFTMRASGSYPDRMPSGFSIEKSNDRTTWLNVKTFSGLAAWAANEKRSFSLVPAPLTNEAGTNLQAENGQLLTTE